LLWRSQSLYLGGYMKALIDHLGYVPETCVWELTRACNLRCGHCGTAAGKARPGELTTDEAIDVARQLADLGNRLTTLSGGEPTLRKDWPVIARTLVEAGVTVNMVTNGQGDGRELASLAEQAGLSNVAVSLDGLETTHDWLRGRGAFARATGTIRELVMAGFWVDVMFTVNRVNMGELADIWELTKRLAAKRLRVQLGKPMGNQTNRIDLTLEPKDLLTLMPLLGRLAARTGPEVRIGDSIGYFSPEERLLRGRYCDQGHWTGCYAGVRAIGIQADGGVKGCLSLQPREGDVDPFIEGNLHTDSLKAIWTRPTAFAYNRNFTLGSLKGACAKCSHASLCRGGATCVAYTYSGAPGCDPMCYFHAAGLSAETRSLVWPVSASAAATAILVSLGGCGGESAGSSGATGGAASTSGGSGQLTSASSGKGGQSTVSSGQGGVSAAMDYGAIAPSGGAGTVTSGSGTTSRGGVSAVLDYGVIEPTGGATGKTSSAVSRGGASIVMDYGVIPAEGGKGGQSASSFAKGGASMAPDYGIMGPSGGKASAGGASTQPTGGTAGTVAGGGKSGGAGPAVSGAAGNAGTTSNVAGNAGGAGKATIDCSSVCCNCDYGIIPPETYKTCC
jgi:radical SAM protein with 4Fe4S-binding SPASM domain